MKMTTLMVALLASLAACKDLDPRVPRETGPAQIVSLVVRTEPAGATVRVNKLSKTWTSPCDIADYGIAKGLVDVEVSLMGYQTVTTKAKYDGFEPVTLELRLVKLGAAAAPAPVEPAPAVAAVPAPAPAPKPAPPAPAALPQEKPAAAEPAPAPGRTTVKVEAVPGGTRVKLVNPGARIRINAKSVVTEADKPGEMFLPNVPPDKVTIDFLDAKGDGVIGSVELTPPAVAPVAARPPDPAPAPAPAAEADRVGEVKVASKTYGVYVKLEPGLELQPGEELLIYRDGKEVGRTKIVKITKADPKYPDGAAQVQKEGTIQKGDEVRRQKP